MLSQHTQKNIEAKFKRCCDESDPCSKHREKSDYEEFEDDHRGSDWIKTI